MKAGKIINGLGIILLKLVILAIFASAATYADFNFFRSSAWHFSSGYLFFATNQWINKITGES